MARTYKIQAAHVFFKAPPDRPYAVHVCDIRSLKVRPGPVKAKLEYIGRGAGYRYGNNRRYYAALKVIARRVARAKEKRELRWRLSDEVSDDG